MALKIGIVGSRKRDTLNDYHDIEKYFGVTLTKHNLGLDDVQIVSGGCPTGVDRWAEVLAKSKCIPITIYYAKWYKYGQAAGPMRNRIIAKESDYLIALPGPESKGTHNTIRYFKETHFDWEKCLIIC